MQAGGMRHREHRDKPGVPAVHEVLCKVSGWRKTAPAGFDRSPAACQRTMPAILDLPGLPQVQNLLSAEGPALRASWAAANADELEQEIEKYKQALSEVLGELRRLGEQLKVIARLWEAGRGAGVLGRWTWMPGKRS